MKSMRLLQTALRVDRPKAIAQRRCVTKPFGCGNPAIFFKDELSWKEYTISGLCQDCQDEVFREE